MILQMLMAHLVGDFVLQTNNLAAWKGRSRWGVIFHGTIVLLVTVAITYIYQPQYEIPFVKWAFFIGITHVLIDLSNLKFTHFVRDQGYSALMRFVIDQMLHLGAIFGALYFAGYELSLQALIHQISEHTILAAALVYVWMSMPAWVAIEFFMCGIFKHQAPDFVQATSYKYLGIFYRWIITSAVFAGAGLWAVLIPIAWQLYRHHAQIIERLERLSFGRVPSQGFFTIPSINMSENGLVPRIIAGTLPDIIITGALAVITITLVVG